MGATNETSFRFDGEPPIYFNWDIAVDIELEMNETAFATGYYLLDGFGAVHEVGAAKEFVGKPYFGWDIARDFMTYRYEDNEVRGYMMLDGFGGLHPVNVPRAQDAPYFSWDIAREITAPPSGNGMYIIDGFGGVHPVDGAMPLVNVPYFGWDVLRDFEIFEMSE
jgi:hypothetical protein